MKADGLRAIATATVAWLGLLALAVSGAAGQDAVELTLERMARMDGVGAPVFSPDGEELALTRSQDGVTRIWVLSRDGEAARPFPSDGGAGREPSWSPDGTRIAFLRSGGGESEIWVADRDGGDARRLTGDGGGKRALVWSPDGTAIAFISGLAGHQDVWVADVSTGETRQLTRETNDWDEFRWAPTWSPSGSHIAYVSSRGGEWNDDLWLVDLNTGQTEKLTSDVQVMSDPKWSDDGGGIAFNGMRYGEFWYGDQSDIWVVRMPEGDLRRVDTNVHASDRNGSVAMQWSPTGDRLYVRYEWEGDANLWSVPVEGGVATKITYDEGSLGEFSVSPDGEAIAYVRSTPTRGGEVHRVDLAGGAPVPLTQWSTRFAGLRAPEKITFRSRDGHHILGYLYHPPDFDPQRRYPAVVQLHGGGNNAYGNGFHALDHLLARHGYVVLAVEYRGSAGHGRAFQDLALGDWAAGQGWDAVAAAEFLGSLDYTTGRVGVYGGSYGGIMTLAGLTRDPAPFDAAAPLYGIYDWETAYQDGDRLMRFWIIEGHEGFRPGEAPDRYRRTGTIHHLDGIPTDLPFLILHGELDRRAPFSQSVRLSEALRHRGNPVTFHAYPDEGHGFSRPENRIHAYGLLLEFFQRHLKTGGIS